MKKEIKELKEEIKILKRWVIINIEYDLHSFTYPLIEKATERNIEKAIEQNKDAKKGSLDYIVLQNLKEDLKVFKIIKKLKGEKE